MDRAFEIERASAGELDLAAFERAMQFAAAGRELQGAMLAPAQSLGPERHQGEMRRSADRVFGQSFLRREGARDAFPNEGSAGGALVFQLGDIAILSYCRQVQDPVRLRIMDGVIRKVEGGLDAKLMRDWLDDNKMSANDTDPCL